MNKPSVVFVRVGLILAVLAVTACASTSGMPSSIERARRKAPKDVLVGIGSAKIGTVTLYRTIAATRARAELSKAINSIVMSMVTNYTASSEVDPEAVLVFRERITVTLSQANLSGAVIVEEAEDKNGNWWCVIYLSRENVAGEISRAQATAKQAVPAMASFDAEAGLNLAFERQVSEMAARRD